MSEVCEYGEPGSTFIQWKGTSVCMDVICRCGEHLHFDTWFAYYIGCEFCGRVFKVGDAVTLTRVDPSEGEVFGEDDVKWSDGRNWWNP